MTPNDETAAPGVSDLLDGLAAVQDVQSNCMFQLALMLARVAVEPGAESYKDETAQKMLGLIRDKPKSNVVRLFGAVPAQDRSGLTRLASA